jgi:hypothetical protein
MTARSICRRGTKKKSEEKRKASPGSASTDIRPAKRGEGDGKVDKKENRLTATGNPRCRPLIITTTTTNLLNLRNDPDRL